MTGIAPAFATLPTEDGVYFLEYLANEAERGASFIRRQTPASLRAWADRLESQNAEKARESLPARFLEMAAADARRLAAPEVADRDA